MFRLRQGFGAARHGAASQAKENRGVWWDARVIQLRLREISVLQKRVNNDAQKN
jgi:hypothetical protein